MLLGLRQVVISHFFAHLLGGDLCDSTEFCRAVGLQWGRRAAFRLRWIGKIGSLVEHALAVLEVLHLDQTLIHQGFEAAVQTPNAHTHFFS